MKNRILACCSVIAGIASMLALTPSRAETPTLPTADPVVVATFDTGTNPFHPCFRRPGLTNPSQVIPNFPDTASPLDLTFSDNYSASEAASGPAISAIEDRKLYYIPDTNLTFYGGTHAKDQLIDQYPHGAQASSQIACDEFGMGSNSLLVILNWYFDTSQGSELIRWAADQPWIDIIHLNIQDFPLLVQDAPEVRYAISKGKLLVVAAGNGVYGQGVNYPMELSKWNGPPGSLIAGANDNDGYTAFSNINPHVVMDGNDTVAAAPNSFGSTSFGGTSSASPRLTGYAARIVGALRHQFGHAGEGLVQIPAANPRPATGPLKDGSLTAAELHEVIRRTADPNPHESYYDGDGGLGSFWQVPQPFASPVAMYAKMGYGEVSEHTVMAAVDVASGRLPSPLRAEDGFYLASEATRFALWSERGDSVHIEQLHSTGADPGNDEGVIGISTPLGLSEGDVYSISTVEGQSVTISLSYNAALPDQDIDIYLFKGDGPSFVAGDVRRSTLPSGSTETIQFVAEGGTYSIVALGWQIVLEQPYTLTTDAANSFVGDDYYLSTFGSGLF